MDNAGGSTLSFKAGQVSAKCPAIGFSARNWRPLLIDWLSSTNTTRYFPPEVTCSVKCTICKQKRKTDEKTHKITTMRSNIKVTTREDPKWSPTFWHETPKFYLSK